MKNTFLKLSAIALLTTSMHAYDSSFNEDRLECVALHDIFVNRVDTTGIKAYNLFIEIKCEDETYTPPKWKSYYFMGKEISKKQNREGCNKECSEQTPFYYIVDENGKKIWVGHPREDKGVFDETL